MSAALLSAGCIGFGGDEDGNETDDGDDGLDTTGNNTTGPPPGNETGNQTSGNETGNQTGNQTSGNETGNQTGAAWAFDNRTGTVSGLGLIITSPSAEETFIVENGTLSLVLNLTADGGELAMRIAPPDCEPGDECEEEVTTSGGNASYSAESPMGGTWTVTLEPASSLGSSSIDYTLVIGQLAPGS